MPWGRRVKEADQQPDNVAVDVETVIRSSHGEAAEPKKVWQQKAKSNKARYPAVIV